MAQNNLKEKKNVFQKMVLEEQVKHVDLNHYFTSHTKIYLRWATALKQNYDFSRIKKKNFEETLHKRGYRIASRHLEI